MSSGPLLLTATPVIGPGVAYSVGDLIGSKLTFGTGILNMNEPYLRGVGISDIDKQNAAMTLVLFDNDPSATTFTDNAALAIAAADLPKIIGIFPIATASYASFSANSYVFSSTNVGQIPLVMRGSTLYGCLLSGGTPTYTNAASLGVQLFVSGGF